METVNNAYELITNKLQGWLSTMIEMLPNFAVAILLVLGFVVLGRLAKRLLKRFLPKISDSKNLNNLISTIVYLTVIGTGTFIALGVLKLDKTVTSLLAGAGVIGLALGFAFQDIAANFMAGIIMALRKPIKVGDLVQSNDVFGTVKKINLRATEIHTLQGQAVLVPNKLIFENPITNYTTTEKRRVDISCGVSYGDDLSKAKQVTIDALQKLDIIDSEKGISFFFNEFGGSSINYVVRYWVKKSTGQFDFLDAQSQGIMAIKEAYDQHGIMIPFPIRTLDFGIRGGEKLSAMLSNKVENSNGQLRATEKA